MEIWPGASTPIVYGLNGGVFVSQDLKLDCL